MNKIKIAALIAAMGMGLAACDEYTLPNPPAQTNPDGDMPIYNASDLTVSSAISGDAINLLTTQDEMVKFATYSVENLPEGYTFASKVVLSADKDFANSDTLATELSGADIMLSKAEMEASIIKVFGNNPSAKQVYTEVLAYAVNGSNTVRLGNPGTELCAKEYTITPIGCGHVIESEYYLVGNFCDWDVTKGIKFTKLEEGDPYDHPTFMVAFDVPADMADGYQWKVVPASAVAAGNWDGAWGVEPDVENDLEGKLIPSAASATDAGVISSVGSMQININMFDLTYKVSSAYPYLWVFGAGTSNTDASKALPLATDNFINYSGTVRLRRTFFFATERDSRSVSFRKDGDAETDEKTDVTTGKMKIDPNSRESMQVPSTTGMIYYIQANVVTLTWSAVPIKLINIIGAFNGWDVEKAPAMTPNSQNTVWTIKDIELEGEFKFCVSNAWTYSYGGSEDNIVQNGGNLSVPEKGTYDVELHFDKYPNYVTITKK